jgi:hypothetical protein
MKPSFAPIQVSYPAESERIFADASFGDPVSCRHLFFLQIGGESCQLICRDQTSRNHSA